MTDVKRIQELRAALDLAPHIPNRGEVEDALDEFARFKGAALSVPEIEERHAATRLRVPNLNVYADAEAADKDRATLLDALRAKEAEQSGLFADGVRALKERDEARAQLAQAQKEIEQLRDCKRPGTIVEPGCGQCVACLRGLYQDANDRAEERRHAAKKSRHLEEQLAQAERDKAAMRKIVEAVARPPAEYNGHCILCGAHLFNEKPHEDDCAHRLAVEWKRDHGALVPQEGEVVVTNCLYCGNGITKHRPDCYWSEDKTAGAEILAAHRCDCATKPVNLASVCDPCKNSLPEGLWLRFVASELPQRLEAAAEIERILKARAAHRDAKTEPSK